MYSRPLAIASVAVMALSMPARADLILLFLDKSSDPTLGNSINDFRPYGNLPYDDSSFGGGSAPALDPITSITITAGQTRLIQVALLDTLIGNTYPPLAPGGNPASSIPPTTVNGTFYNNPRWTYSFFQNPPQQLFGLTLWETRISGTVLGPASNPTGGAFIAPPNAVPGLDPDYGNDRLALVHPGAAFLNAGSMPPYFTDFGGLLATGFGAYPNRNFNDFVNQPQLGGRFALFNFEITTVANDPGGTYPITISDRSVFNDFEVRATGSGGFGTPGDRIALDSVIFSAAHPTYTLNVTVTPVPEPSSIALIGMATAGFSYRHFKKWAAKGRAAR